MSKKEICSKNKSVGYWSVCGGVEVKSIDFGCEDYVYCISNAWGGKKGYHKLKINYTNDDAYVVLDGYRLYFNECIRI